MIKLQLDRNSDTLYLRLGYAPVVESEEVSPGIVLDYNDKVTSFPNFHSGTRMWQKLCLLHAGRPGQLSISMAPFARPG